MAGSNFIHQHKNLTANGTTVLRQTECFLHSVTINTKGASSNTLTLYDNNAGSGTKIATIDTTSAVGTLHFDVACKVGLTAVLGSGTAADVTVSCS